MNLFKLMPDHDVLMRVADEVRVRVRKKTCRRELMMRWERNRVMRYITRRGGLHHEGRVLLLSPGDIDRQLWHSAGPISTGNSGTPLAMRDSLNTKYFISGIRIFPIRLGASHRLDEESRPESAMTFDCSFNLIIEQCLKKGWKPPFEGTTREEFISSVRFLMNNEDIIEY